MNKQNRIGNYYKDSSLWVEELLVNMVPKQQKKTQKRTLKDQDCLKGY
jgi:hypothetical protein